MAKQLVDPYVYPSSNVLINKLGIKEQSILDDTKGILVHKSLGNVPNGNFDFDHLKSIHKHLFQELYTWAGQIREINMKKFSGIFCSIDYLNSESNKLFNKLKAENFLADYKTTEEFANRLSFYSGEIHAIHPFRDGNSRTNKIFFQILANRYGYNIDWTKISRQENIEAYALSHYGDNTNLDKLFNKIISKQIITTLDTTEPSLAQLSQLYKSTSEENRKAIIKQITSKIADKLYILEDKTSNKLYPINNDPKDVIETMKQVDHGLGNFLSSKDFTDRLPQKLNFYSGMDIVDFINKIPNAPKIEMHSAKQWLEQSLGIKQSSKKSLKF